MGCVDRIDDLKGKESRGAGLLAVFDVIVDFRGGNGEMTPSDAHLTCLSRKSPPTGLQS